MSNVQGDSPFCYPCFGRHTPIKILDSSHYSYRFREAVNNLLAPRLATALAASFNAQAQTSNVPGGATSLEEIRVLPSAEEVVQQAPGVSTITADDIKKRPPANDLSELIRTMPGVNLTGNSPSGSYGHRRQIDLRGMGPENTLILIDGKPVSSLARPFQCGELRQGGDSWPRR